MVDLLVATVLTGLATTFILELISLGAEYFIRKETLYAVMAMPIAFGLLWMLIDIDKPMVVAVPASAFVATVLMKYLNKPVVAQVNRLPRL